MLHAIWRFVTTVGSALAAVAALAHLGERLIDGFTLLVTIVRVYQAVLYPLEEAVFGGLGWTPPSRELVDLFVVILFTRNIILSFFLRDILRENGAGPRAYADSRFTWIYVDNYLARIWFPFVLTAFYWVQGFLLREVAGIPVSLMQVVLFWGLFGGVKGLITTSYSVLPRWFLYPYIEYRVAYTGLKHPPSLFRRYHFWLLFIIIPLIFELNKNAETVRPILLDLVKYGSDTIRDLTGRNP